MSRPRWRNISKFRAVALVYTVIIRSEGDSDSERRIRTNVRGPRRDIGQTGGIVPLRRRQLRPHRAHKLEGRFT